MSKAILEIVNCIDCPFHSVEADPDPQDWFCDDDVKVVCTKIKKNVTVACRPYNIRKESEVPTWCPLISAPPKNDTTVKGVLTTFEKEYKALSDESRKKVDTLVDEYYDRVNPLVKTFKYQEAAVLRDEYKRKIRDEIQAYSI